MVNKKPKGLGRGLEALLGPKVEDKPAGEASAGAPSTLALDELVPGQYQPRTRMDEGALYELAESIKAQGIMQPILVRKLTSGPNAGKHEIIAGERRFRASKLAGLSAVPVLVREVTADRVKAYFGALVRGGVERYGLPNLGALNFLLHQSLGGGGTLSLRVDAQGKTLGLALLGLEIEVEEELLAIES